jgi:hypothetical protein
MTACCPKGCRWSHCRYVRRILDPDLDLDRIAKLHRILCVAHTVVFMLNISLPALSLP